MRVTLVLGIIVVIAWTAFATIVSKEDLILTGKSTVTAVLRPSELPSQVTLGIFCLTGIWAMFAGSIRQALRRIGAFLACMLITLYAHRSIALSLTDRTIVEYLGSFEVRTISFDAEPCLWFPSIESDWLHLHLVSNTGEAESLSWGLFPGRIPEKARRYLVEQIEGRGCEMGR